MVHVIKKIAMKSNNYKIDRFGIQFAFLLYKSSRQEKNHRVSGIVRWKSVEIAHIKFIEEDIMSRITASRYIAEAFKAYGVTHFFYVPVIIPEACKEMQRMGITPVMTHGEKAAAYMADGYARVSHRVGVCGAQTIGGTNLAAGCLR